MSAEQPTAGSCSDDDVALLDAVCQRTPEASTERRLLTSVREYAARDAAGTDRAVLGLFRPPLAARLTAARPLLNEALTAPADRIHSILCRALDILYPDPSD